LGFAQCAHSGSFKPGADKPLALPELSNSG
jgi:hypothetical protein